MVDLAIESWQLPDASIWESRGRELHYTYSKMMCWVAVDRGLRLAERFGLRCDRERWEEARRAIHRTVTTEGYHRGLRSFTQTLGGRTLDAAMLRAGQVRFLDDRDPRIVATVRAVARHLGRGVLVSRYRPEETDDGIDHGEEGAFLMCSFWLADALAHIGEVEQAQRRFERLLSFGSPLGLMAEEADVDHRGPARQLPAGLHPPGPDRRRRQHRARPPPAARGQRAARRGPRPPLDRRAARLTP